MPTYEYACTACGERVEAKQGFDDPPLEICELCGGKLRKLYSPVGIVFKGSGFYSTDARKGTSTSTSSASSGSEDSKSKREKPKGDSSGSKEKTKS